MARQVKKVARYKALTLTMQNNIMTYSGSLGVLGAKIFRYAIATINSEEKKFEEIRISAKELSDLIHCDASYLREKGREYASQNSSGSSDGNNYFNQFAKASLFYFPEKGNEEWMVLNLWSYFGYDHGEFTFKLNDDFAKFLLDIDPRKGGYFRTEFQDYVPGASTETEIILYEQLMQRKYLAGKPSCIAPNVDLESNEIIFDIPWLRKLLTAEGTYVKDSDFYTKCIQPAVENISARTKLKVECEAVNADWTSHAMTHVIFRYLDLDGISAFEFPALAAPVEQRKITQKLLQEMQIEVCNQIDYPLIPQYVKTTLDTPDPNIKRALNIIVNVMAETLCLVSPEEGVYPDADFTIGNSTYDAEYVYEKLKAVTCSHVSNFLGRMLRSGAEIKNSQNYILSSLIAEVTAGAFQDIMRAELDSYSYY